MKRVLLFLPVLAICTLALAQEIPPHAGATSPAASPTPTPALTPAAPPTPRPLLDMKLYEWGQLAVWTAALAFFGYKAFTGYFVTDMSVKIACERKHKTGQTDFLAVTVIARKGERGGLHIHDGQARVRDLPGTPPQELIGIRRMDQKNTNSRASILWTEPDYRLNLPAGDEMQFAALFEVPCGQAFTVEAAILGKKLGRFHHKVGQWRACCVSLPHDPAIAPAASLGGPTTARSQTAAS